MWKCTCGEENDESIKFCPNCGTRQDAEDGIEDTENTEDTDSTEITKEDGIESDDGDKSGEPKESLPNADSIVIVRSAATWTCSCGETNPGKSGMCRACGKSSFDKGDGLSAPSFGSGGLEAPKTGFFPEKKKGFFSSITAPAETYTPKPISAPAITTPPVSGWMCSCGATNPDDSNFCSGCGRPNPASHASVPTTSPAITPAASFTPPVGEVYTAPAPEPAVPEVSMPIIEKEPEIKLPMTTSSGFEGKEIVEYVDVVCGNDMYTTGGIANCLQYSYSFEQAKKDLAKKAHELGADAVISLQTTVFSPQKAFFLVSVTGTAVKLAKEESEEKPETEE